MAEALALHLLLGGGWVAWGFDAVHAYMLVWLWGFALGPRAYPHRVGPRRAIFRAGPKYGVLVPRSAVIKATDRRLRVYGDRGLVLRDEGVLLPVRGRVDVWLELSEPVRVPRPLHEASSHR